MDEETTQDPAEETSAQELTAAALQAMKPEALAAELEKTRAALKTANAESAARRKKLESYADYGDLKKAADELKTLKQAQLSETEKRDARIKDLEGKITEHESQVKARELEVTERLIRAEVRMMASGLGFTSPDDAYALADLAEITIDDKGAVQGVQKALEKLAKEKAYLIKGAAGPGSPPNDPKKKGSAEADWMAEAQRRYGIKPVPSQGGQP